MNLEDLKIHQQFIAVFAFGPMDRWFLLVSHWTQNSKELSLFVCARKLICRYEKETRGELNENEYKKICFNN